MKFMEIYSYTVKIPYLPKIHHAEYMGTSGEYIQGLTLPGALS